MVTPERNMADGHCKFGPKCRFSHDPTTLCYSFQTPKGCPKGASCFFSHRPTSSAVEASADRRNNRGAPTVAEQDYEVRFRQWTYLIPKQNGGRRLQHGPPDTKAFFKAGWELMTSSDASGRQRLIKKLSTDEGLNMIKTLADTMDSDQQEPAILATFEGSVIFFYRTISHPEVVSSLVLERPLETIYNFLYGSGGRRGVDVVRFTAKAISLLVIQYEDDAYEKSNVILDPCFATLGRMIELNQGAQLHHELVPMVESISACATPDKMFPDLRRKLDKIRIRLGLGSLMPTAKISKHSATRTATFKLRIDLPGGLSIDGPRHDNDHEDIADIQILPTADEIQCSRVEYLPSSDPSNNHLIGLPGLLDRQFRLLREDAIGGLRDAVRREAEHLEQVPLPAAQAKQRQLERTHVHANLRLRRWELDRRKGIQLVVEFDQPITITDLGVQHRKEWWDSSRRLQPSTLVCLVSSTGQNIFCLVCDPKPTAPSKKKHREDSDDEEGDEVHSVAELEYRRKMAEMPSLYQDGSRAAVMLTLVQEDCRHIAWISQQFTERDSTVRISLVEFPGVLLPSFQPTLEALQQMSQRLDLPFTEHLAPQVPEQGAQVTAPPLYAQRQGFAFDLSPLTKGEPLKLSAQRPFDWNAFNNITSLDEAQQAAVIYALNNSFALIQGPPGTGKSYTGVSIIKVLLRNRNVGELGPIICVCYTNHALDQLLEHLVQDGVEQVVRIGSRSKSELLKNVNLHDLAQQVAQTKNESHEKYLLNQQLTSSMAEIASLLKELNTLTSEASIKDYLEENSPKHFRELFQSPMEEDGFTLVGRRDNDLIKSWLKAAKQGNRRDRPAGMLLNLPLEEMSTAERRRLYTYWVAERSEQLGEQLDDALEPYKDTRLELDKYFKEQQRRALSQAHVIGVTTSGLARNLEVLRNLQSKVLICEEAGEVLEAHILTALLPSIEHAILIGDHEQLRPQVKNYELCHDNPRGKHIALDISLFERLVQRGDNAKIPSLPLSRLKIQRRMHPSIANLVRSTIYPDLEDYHTVLAYPSIDGMKDRLYWMTHQNREDGADLMQSQADSKSNDFEVQMVSALASHLVRQGTYSHGDIAVLTPYVLQLQKIRRSLGEMFEISINDRDLQALEDQGEVDAPPTPLAKGPTVKKTALLGALRVATVDNFQGEEAKVIILSFVRSNAEGKCGFLRTSNRINVALSRARHGMYTIGDARTASSVPMWAKVLRILEAQDSSDARIGSYVVTHVRTSATAMRFMRPFTVLSAVSGPKRAAITLV
ncbi:MAG: hypothetical protein Q9172_004035 [Xanthocarpia lactea]